jgi:DnaJ family protein C protein 17
MSEQRNTNELVALAKELASADIDLYNLLGIAADAATDSKLIQTGFRKQSLLKHPDKAGANYDPVAWSRIQQAKDILLEPAARSAYDQARGASLLRKQEKQRLGREQRRYVDELEAAERDAKRKKAEEDERIRELERMRAQMRDEGLRKQQQEEEERAERLRKEAESTGPSLDEQEAELLKRLEAKARKREERAQRKREKAERKGDGQSKVSAYFFSTDPKLSYEEKVTGVMGKLRARQRERQAVDAAMEGA